MEISGSTTIGATSENVKTPREPRKNSTEERVAEERRNPPQDSGRRVTTNRDGDTVALG